MLKSHWGFNRVEKYNEEYFLESDRETDSLCPFSLPDWCDCPHITHGEPRKMFWTINPAIYLNESTESFPMPSNVIIKSSVYYYRGVETAREIIKNKEMLKTNYVPLVIMNFNVDGKQNRFLDLLLPEVQKIGRSIILETGGIRVPVPYFVRRIENEKVYD